MHLVEHIHYETVEIQAGRFVYEGAGGPPWGYCYDNFDGSAKVLRIIHPDIDSREIAKFGDHLRKLRMIQNQKLKRLEKRTG